MEITNHDITAIQSDSEFFTRLIGELVTYVQRNEIFSVIRILERESWSSRDSILCCTCFDIQTQRFLCYISDTDVFEDDELIELIIK